MIVKLFLIVVVLASLTQAARPRQGNKSPSGKCLNKLMTSYSRKMLDAIRPSSAYDGTYHLQQRFVAGVHLYGGMIQGMQKIQPIEEPTRLYCHNDTMAALQTVSGTPADPSADPENLSSTNRNSKFRTWMWCTASLSRHRRK